MQLQNKMALRGIKVVEMLGLAPGPFCGMVLADFGASVTVVQKIEPLPFEVMSNGKRTISVDLKSSEGVQIVRKLCSSADIFLDTFRPGVMEKLGLGPDVLYTENPKLIYARLTGYGQYGHYAQKAGHDINYVGTSGVLSMLTKNKEPPVPPINLLADFAGGSLSCVLGVLLALHERVNSGKGQVIDVSMVEGAAYLATWLYKSRKLPIWTGEPGSNILDGGAPFYRTYKTKDSKFMAVGALEHQFYKQLLKGLQLSEDEYGQFNDLQANEIKFKEIFLTKTQNEWCDIFDKLDACVTPVVKYDAPMEDKHNKSRESFFVDTEDYPIPKPAPKLSRTPGLSIARQSHPQPGEHTVEVLQELGYTKSQVNKFIETGVVYSHKKCSL